MIPDLGALKDIPVILNSVANDIEYEGNYDSVRYVNWTLTFTMKMHFYGPISYPKIIRTVYANIYNDPSYGTGTVSTPADNTQQLIDAGFTQDPNTGDWTLQ